MKKNIFLGILFLGILFMSVNSVFKTDESDMSLSFLVQKADAYTEWSSVRNWLKSDRKQSEVKLKCVYYKTVEVSGTVGVSTGGSFKRGEPVEGKKTICDALGEGCNALKCH